MNPVLLSVCVVMFIGRYGECWKIPSTNDIFDHGSEMYKKDLKRNEGPEKFGITLESPNDDVYEELLNEWSLKQDNDNEEYRKDKDEDTEYEENDAAESNKEEEEMIRNAEKLATKDLLDGLKRILINNETLDEVLAAEKDESF